MPQHQVLIGLAPIWGRKWTKAMLLSNWLLCNTSDSVKINYLLIWAWDEGQEISEMFVFQGDERKNVESYINKFKAFMKLRSNFQVLWHKLMRYQQEANEMVHAFLKGLQQQIKLCEYEHEFETMLVDLFICRINFKSTQSPIKRRKGFNDCVSFKSSGNGRRYNQMLTRSYLCPGRNDKHVIKNKSARGKTCMKCKKIGHFACACLKWKKNRNEDN